MSSIPRLQGIYTSIRGRAARPPALNTIRGPGSNIAARAPNPFPHTEIPHAPLSAPFVPPSLLNPNPIQRTFIGRVISTRMQKTINVEINQFRRHRILKKYIRVTSKFFTHDELEECDYGDIVEIKPCRPLSKRKHFTLFRILEKKNNIYFPNENDIDDEKQIELNSNKNKNNKENEKKIAINNNETIIQSNSTSNEGKTDENGVVMMKSDSMNTNSTTATNTTNTTNTNNIVKGINNNISNLNKRKPKPKTNKNIHQHPKKK